MVLLDTLLGIGSKVLDRVVPDKNKKQEQDHQEVLAQIDVNKAQAQSSNLFVAGARPFLMWAFGGAFAYQIIIYPVLSFYGIEAPKLPLEIIGKVLMVIVGGGVL